MLLIATGKPVDTAGFSRQPLPGGLAHRQTLKRVRFGKTVDTTLVCLFGVLAVFAKALLLQAAGE